ncbi:MAG: FliO/MopB family protein [Phycisphaerales bacterium]
MTTISQSLSRPFRARRIIVAATLAVTLGLGGLARAQLGPDPHAAPTSTSAESLEARALPARSAEAAPQHERQPLSASNGAGVGWMRLGGGLCIVIGAILLLKILVQRFGGPLAGGRGPSGVVEVLGRFPFGQRQSLILLKVDRRVLLLCQTSAGATTLTEFNEAAEVASLLSRVQDDEKASFNHRLEEILRDSRQPTEGRRRGKSNGEETATPSTVIDLTRRPRPARGAGRRRSTLEVRA